ncbi:MAG: hypothetical protein E7632_03795 [Ruminococcaceae bacterium]|nr:hypothetical protein [Oscillospiraceae bacterium]
MSERNILPIGDGICDDTDAIQELLDSGISEVFLPGTTAHYVISRTLIIHSGQTLRLPLMATIRLADGADCLMLANASIDDHDIAVIGGIWDFNNLGQSPNPLATGKYQCGETCDAGHFMEDYMGVVMRFCGIKRLTLRDITIKDPVTFGIELAHAEEFTIENIRFDFNFGNPAAVNMDGVHIDGFCHFGTIRNLKGTCYDDLLALNADDFLRGPISDIEVDGIFADNCHSAVRLLSTRSRVERISIRNVYGTYYQYAIGVTRFYAWDGIRGEYDALSFDNIFVSKAERYSHYCKDGSYVFSPIYVDTGLNVRSLHIRNLHRREMTTAVPLVTVLAGTTVRRLSIEHASQENLTDKEIPILHIAGEVEHLYLRDIDCGGDKLLVQDGAIGSLDLLLQ